MAISYVKDISTNGAASSANATTLAINVDVAPTTGTDAIILEVANDGGNTGANVAVSSIADSRGNTWTKAAGGQQAHAGSLVNCEIWFTNQNAAALLLNDTITITFAAASTNKAALVQEYTPALTADVTQNSASGSSTTAMDTGATATTTQAAELAVAAYGIAQSLAGWTKNASYSLPTKNFRNNGVSRTIMASYQVLASTGTQQATATAGTAGWSVGVIATFKLASVTNTKSLTPTQAQTATQATQTGAVRTPTQGQTSTVVKQTAKTLVP